MPDLRHHLNQSRRNIDFFTGFEKNSTLATYSEWSVTVRFYAAVHIVEAMLSLFRFHSSNHDQRTEIVCSSSVVANVFTKKLQDGYMELYNLSRKARYLAKDGKGASDTDLQDSISSFDDVKNEGIAFLLKSKQDISILTSHIP